MAAVARAIRRGVSMAKAAGCFRGSYPRLIRFMSNSGTRRYGDVVITMNWQVFRLIVREILRGPPSRAFSGGKTAGPPATPTPMACTVRCQRITATALCGTRTRFHGQFGSQPSIGGQVSPGLTEFIAVAKPLAGRLAASVRRVFGRRPFRSYSRIRTLSFGLEKRETTPASPGPGLS